MSLEFFQDEKALVAANNPGELRMPGGVGWRVAEKIRGELGKSVRGRWRVAAKNPGELRRSAGVDGKLPE